jgi:hypothetical protein
MFESVSPFGGEGELLARHLLLCRVVRTVFESVSPLGVEETVGSMPVSLRSPSLYQTGGGGPAPLRRQAVEQETWSLSPVKVERRLMNQSLLFLQSQRGQEGHPSRLSPLGWAR